ncbi:MAG: SPFH/Band 7/PHB domain protein [Oscillospiraceae bacterium]|jgi:regulator of protease activity HflC (stomatin/prohibitin superfamily)|nr:SPFH/Band 7/PHB domain protein [Oscillospiraceae bacterium]
MGTLIAFIILAVVVIVVAIANIRIVPQSEAYVIERLGTYKDTWKAGLHLKIPFIDRISKKVSLKEHVADFPPQPVITKDNVTMQIDSVVFYQVTDPKLYTYGVERPMAAIENLTATTLRNITGDLELDQTLTSRDTINARMRTILDEATDPWGIKVNRVELKNILPPREIQNAMEKQMKAERERRESILRAEGDKASRILTAEGEKQQKITQAEGEKESAILRAEAAKQAAILAAQAEKQSAILRAEGQAEAILKIQQADADAAKLINEADPGQAYITLQSLEAFKAAANGQATKIIIPSEIQGIAALAKGILESAKD